MKSIYAIVSSSWMAVFYCWLAIWVLVSITQANAQTNYQLVRSFGAVDLGTQPHAALILGSDGALYGTTMAGGMANRGTVFRLNVDGSGYEVLHNFSTNYDGKNPVGALLQGQDGMLYGTTVYGGSNGFGTVFTLATDGSNYLVLHNFSKTNIDGEYPYGALVQDPVGELYGTTSLITNGGSGTVYTLNTNGSGFALLHVLATNGVEGRDPRGLIIGQDGWLYGVSQSNRVSAGAIFRINTNGAGFTAWTNLPTSSERSHMNALRQGTNGLLYGATCYNAAAENLFSIGTNGASYTALHTFAKNGVDGQNPDTQLLLGQDGAFYGVTAAGGTNGAGTVFRINGDGSGYAVLYQFQTNNFDGRWPEDSLVQDAGGTLYGTTLRGGFSGDGTVFAIHPDGSGYRQLLQFNSYAAEGQITSGTLVPDGNGSLYGVTHSGGKGAGGTLYKIGTDGSSYVVERHFGGPGDGQWPSGTLLQGMDMAWYGTTYTGGTNNCGTVFKINGDGSGYAIIHHFAGTNDGDVPYDALVQDAAGLLYGTTAAGGTNGAGTVFRLSTNGDNFTVLHTFLANGADGTTPSGSVMLGSDGDLYGLTESGGTNGAGSVFKMNPDGSTYLTLHHFQTNGIDGTGPGGSLLPGPGGIWYGTTQWGGAQGAGTLFSMNPDGSGYATVQNFSSSLTNSWTIRRGLGDLALAGNSALYGTLYEGGTSNGFGGLIFQLATDGNAFAVVHNFGATPGDGLNPSGQLLLAGTSWYGITEKGGALGDGTIYALVGAPEIITQPLSQTVLAGQNVSFSVVDNGSPAFYQWYFESNIAVNANGSDLDLPAVARTNAGEYFLIISNSAGIVVSSNALLTVYVPTKVSPPQFLPDDTVQLTSAYADGWPFTLADVAHFNVQVSSNLVDWQTLTNTLVLTNGMLTLHDDQGTNRPQRFYRIVDFP